MLDDIPAWQLRLQMKHLVNLWMHQPTENDMDKPCQPPTVARDPHTRMRLHPIEMQFQALGAEEQQRNTWRFTASPRQGVPSAKGPYYVVHLYSGRWTGFFVVYQLFRCESYQSTLQLIQRSTYVITAYGTSSWALPMKVACWACYRDLHVRHGQQRAMTSNVILMVRWSEVQDRSGLPTIYGGWVIWHVGNLPKFSLEIAFFSKGCFSQSWQCVEEQPSLNTQLFHLRRVTPVFGALVSWSFFNVLRQVHSEGLQLSNGGMALRASNQQHSCIPTHDCRMHLNPASLMERFDHKDTWLGKPWRVLPHSSCKRISSCFEWSFCTCPQRSSPLTRKPILWEWWTLWDWIGQYCLQYEVRLH